MIYAEHGTLGYRHVNALSWRVASELSRRDPGVYIGLTGYGGSSAMADALMLADVSGMAYQARRCGFGFAAGAGGDFQIPWDRAFGMASPRAIAIALEESRGIHRPEKSPATSPRALGYRVMASMLELTLGDRVQWSTGESRGGPLDPESLATGEKLQDWEDTRWSLFRDSEAVAQLDNFGWLQIRGQKIDLRARYRELNGKIFALTMDVFGGILP